MVLQRIPRGIVGNGCTVIFGQLVLPVGVPVGIAVCLGGCSADGGPRLVGVLLHRGQISSQVIGVGDGFVQVLIILPDQLIQVVIIVFQLQGAGIKPSFDYQGAIVGKRYYNNECLAAFCWYYSIDFILVNTAGMTRGVIDKRHKKHRPNKKEENL